MNRPDIKPFTHTIPMSYLRKGDHFIAVAARGASQRKVLSGVADMDGHEVSDNFGARQGNLHFSNNENENYINIQQDGVEYERPTFPNSSLYARDGWVIFVSPEVYSRYITDRAETRRILKDREDGTKLAEQARARAAEKASILAQIEVLRKKVETLS